jgi:tetratricopeptide (TPR) repeat protein
VATRRAAGWRPLLAMSAAGALLAFFPWAVDDGLANERTERIVHLVVEGRGDEAKSLFDRTLPIHSDPGLLQYRVARAWLDAGKPAAAAEHFEKALAANPAQGEIHLAYGQALLRLERPAEALPHLEKARAAGAFLDVAGLELARALAALGRTDDARAGPGQGARDAGPRAGRPRPRRGSHRGHGGGGPPRAG